MCIEWSFSFGVGFVFLCLYVVVPLERISVERFDLQHSLRVKMWFHIVFGMKKQHFSLLSCLFYTVTLLKYLCEYMERMQEQSECYWDHWFIVKLHFSIVQCLQYTQYTIKMYVGDIEVHFLFQNSIYILRIDVERLYIVCVCLYVVKGTYLRLVGVQLDFETIQRYVYRHSMTQVDVTSFEYMKHCVGRRQLARQRYKERKVVLSKDESIKNKIISTWTSPVVTHLSTTHA